MILFFELEPSEPKSLEIAFDFFDKFRARLEVPFNLLNSPYNKKLLFECDSYYAFLLDIAWFQVYYVGFLALIACIIFGLAWGWYVLPVIMSLLFVFWNPWLYLLMFRLALRKAGFKGKVRKLSAEGFCEKVLSWDR
jgi:small-conductance mechanosensitive channel